MVKMSGGEALVKSLAKEDVEVVSGIPGIQMYGIVAALRDEPGVRMVTTRHEQATTYMADGYARVSGKPGVARSDAEGALVNLAEATNIPVVTSSGGKGTISDDHPLSYGSCFGPRGERQEMNQL